MNDLIAAFANSFGPLQFSCFLLGILATHLYWVLKAKFHKGTQPQHQWGPRATMVVATTVVVVGSLLVGTQSERTARQVKTISAEVQQCQREFFSALDVRSKTANDDKVVQQQQIDALAANSDAMFAWLTALLAPPPEIAALPQDDPQRRDWGIGITNQFNAVLMNSHQVIAKAQVIQVANEKEREAHPYPAPTCGQ